MTSEFITAGILQSGEEERLSILLLNGCTVQIIWFNNDHPKMKIRSSRTHPIVSSNLYDFVSLAQHKRSYFEESW